jgi:hypothetical protein
VVEDSAQQKAEKGITDSLGVNVQAYKYVLALATAHLHDVEWYQQARRRTAAAPWGRSPYDKHIVFLGLPANVATALVTFPYLLATAEAFYRAIRRENGAARPGEYKQGFADRIVRCVLEQKRAAREQPGSAELIRVGTEIAREAMRIEKLFMGKGFSSGYQGDYSGDYQRGYQDGARVDLHGARSGRMLAEGSE